MAKRKTTVLTASSLACLFSCARKYYLSYVMGWRKRKTDDALKFGTAFHKGLEVWFKTHDRAEATFQAFDTAKDDQFDAVTAAKLSALLDGYFTRWGDEKMRIDPECEFAVKFPFLRNCVVCGKMDGVATTINGKLLLIEHKTTGEDISPLSDYWQTINRDQIALYRAAAEKEGIPLVSVIYDVIRKPTISCGVSETPEEFRERLAADCVGAPETAVTKTGNVKVTKRGADFYFARREIPLLDCDMDALARRLYAAKELVKAYGKLAKRFAADGADPIEAYPKCGSTMVCRFCAFRGVCGNANLNEAEWEKGRMFEELECAKKYL